MSVFGRVLTAMATPFDDDLAVDLDGAQRLAAHLLDNGSDGLVVAGTTGESPTLRHDETLALFAAVAEVAEGRGTVVAGVGKNDTAATVTLAREAAETGVNGLLVVSPYYNKPSQRGLLGHFGAVAGATDLPVLVYNIPGRTAVEIAPETLLRLAEEHATIRGVKDAVGDFAKSAWLAARAPEGFALLAGDDVATLPLLAVGGSGLVSVTSHLVGDAFARMIEVFPTDPAAARAIHWRLLPLITTIMTADTSPGPLKAALNMLGLPAGPVRPPLADADDVVVEQVRGALVDAGLEVPA